METLSKKRKTLLDSKKTENEKDSSTMSHEKLPTHPTKKKNYQI
jgi:hypothetical protein